MNKFTLKLYQLTLARLGCEKESESLFEISPDNADQNKVATHLLNWQLSNGFKLRNDVAWGVSHGLGW